MLVKCTLININFYLCLIGSFFFHRNCFGKLQICVSRLKTIQNNFLMQLTHSFRIIIILLTLITTCLLIFNYNFIEKNENEM